MLQKYAIMLLSKMIFLGHKNTFSHKTVKKHIKRLQDSRIEANCHSMLSSSALVLLKLSEASSPESSTSSLLLETVVNFVPEAKLSDRLLVLQPGSLRLAIFSYWVMWKLRMRNMHGAKTQLDYAGIMCDALKGELCSKLCQHNICTPTSVVYHLCPNFVRLRCGFHSQCLPQSQFYYT